MQNAVTKANRKWTAGRIALTVVVWLLTLLLAAAFGGAGMAKLTSGGGWARSFAHWGFPVWFRIAIGVAEIGTALLLLVPRTARYGAVLVVAIMIGALVTKGVHHELTH